MEDRTYKLQRTVSQKLIFIFEISKNPSFARKKNMTKKTVIFRFIKKFVWLTYCPFMDKKQEN